MALRSAEERSQLLTQAMARLIAKTEIIAEIRRRGEKSSHSAKALTELADGYIKTHRSEIMRELVMRRWERRFAPMRCADFENLAQKSKACNHSGNFVQMLRAKLDFGGGQQ